MTLRVVAKPCWSNPLYCTYRVETLRSIKPEPSSHNLLSKCPPSLEVITNRKKHQKLEREGTFVKRVDVKPSENFCAFIAHFEAPPCICSSVSPGSRKASVTYERCTGLSEELFTRQDTFRIINRKSSTLHELASLFSDRKAIGGLKWEESGLET